jgi:hypothetical protein
MREIAFLKLILSSKTSNSAKKVGWIQLNHYIFWKVDIETCVPFILSGGN